jgi:hypothetical protein
MFNWKWKYTTALSSLDYMWIHAHYKTPPFSILRSLIIHSRREIRLSPAPAAEQYERLTEIPNSHYTKTILKGAFLCFSFAHPFVHRSIHKRLPCVRQKPLFNCVWGRALISACLYLLYVYAYNVSFVSWALLACKLYACFVLILHRERVQVHNERCVYIYIRSQRGSRQLTQFRVSPNRSELLRSHCAISSHNVFESC